MLGWPGSLYKTGVFAGLMELVVFMHSECMAVMAYGFESHNPHHFQSIVN
jgi:hypothetical protein